MNAHRERGRLDGLRGKGVGGSGEGGREARQGKAQKDDEGAGVNHKGACECGGVCR